MSTARPFSNKGHACQDFIDIHPGKRLTGRSSLGMDNTRQPLLEEGKVEPGSWLRGWLSSIYPTTWVWTLRPTEWEERINVHKLSYDFFWKHVSVQITHTHILTSSHAYMHKINRCHGGKKQVDIQTFGASQSKVKEHTFEMVERKTFGHGRVLSSGWWVRLPLGILCFHHQVLLEK